MGGLKGQDVYRLHEEGDTQVAISLPRMGGLKAQSRKYKYYELNVIVKTSNAISLSKR
jgi:hypothetical protein